MGFFSRLLGRKDAADQDAATIYAKLMHQSRDPLFYGPERFPDNYDGRIDVLTLHVAVILEALRSFDEQGQRLSQALFDHLKDDFEIALREEGISDTGVAKRIKPMIRLVYTRVKDYTEALQRGAINNVVSKLYVGTESEISDVFLEKLKAYSTTFRHSLSEKTLGEIASGRFDFPNL